MIPYLTTLSLTIAIELMIVAVVRRFVPALRERSTLSTCLCINLVTHPLASLACLGLGLPILGIELAVIVAESIGYRTVAGISARWSIVLAVVANLASMLFGFVGF